MGGAWRHMQRSVHVALVRYMRTLKAFIGISQHQQLVCLARELVFFPTYITPKQRRQVIRQWLMQCAKVTGKPWQDLLESWHAMMQRRGIDTAAYRLWLACQQPVSSRALNGDMAAEVAFSLPKGDRLSPHALHVLAQAFAAYPSVVMVYTDHDHLDASGERYLPHFKPDWNPDLFASQDYLEPAVFFRRSWLEQLPTEVLDGANWQQVLASLAADQILHIPQILYHRSGGEPPVCGRHLVFPLPTPPPLVSIIIPTRDRLDILKPCVESILKLTTYGTYEILVVDNGSEQAETLAWFSAIQQDDQRVRVLAYPQPFNYSAINNFAVRHARGSVLALVNNDIEVISPAWLGEMVSHACRPEIGCVGAKLYYADGRIQHAGVILGSGGGSGHAHRYFPGDADGYCGRLKVVQNFTAVTGACLVVRKALYEQVGGLNETDLPIAWSDIDLCLKVRALGYRNLWTPYAELYHHESVSRGRDRSKTQRQRYHAETAYMRQVWGDALWQDPCYNPNLTVAREDFSLGLPLPCRWP